MADRMDELLYRVGNEANESIDFEAAFAQVLAKAQAKEKEQAQSTQRVRKWPFVQTRYLSMAAGVVLLLGVAVLLGRSGLMAKSMDSAAPQSPAAGEPEIGMAMEGADMAAASEAEPSAAFAAPSMPADGPMMVQSSRITDSPFYGTAAITVPAAGSGAEATLKAPANATAMPEETLQNGSHDAYDDEGGICLIGETDPLAAQEKLAELGYTASFSTDAHMDQLASLLPGEACIANSGEIAVWNTGNGFLTLWDPALGQMELYDLLMQAI